MNRLLCIDIHTLALVGLLCVSASCFGMAPPLVEKKTVLLAALEDFWKKGYAGNSDSCYYASVLVKHDVRLAKLFTEFRCLGFKPEFSRVYRIKGWYVLHLSKPRNRLPLFYKLGRTSTDGDVVYARFNLRPGEWLNIDTYAPALCYGPISQEDDSKGFVKMWDAERDKVIHIPDGFHGLIQGGAGVFLLRSDANGGYYRWDAASGLQPQKWEYEPLYGDQCRSCYNLAKSSKTGKVYAFAVGLNPIPNSEGACWVGPQAAYRGRNVFGFGKSGIHDKTFYYAWPEDPSTEALSAGTETFPGSRMLFPKDGRLLVIYPNPKDNRDIFEVALGKGRKDNNK